MKFSIKDFFNKCDQIHRKLRLVFRRFFDIRGDLGKKNLSSFLPATDWRNPTILVYRKLRSWSHLPKKSLMRNFIFCVVARLSFNVWPVDLCFDAYHNKLLCWNICFDTKFQYLLNIWMICNTNNFTLLLSSNFFENICRKKSYIWHISNIFPNYLLSWYTHTKKNKAIFE